MAISKVGLVVFLSFFLWACDGASVSLVQDPVADNENSEADAPQGDEPEADTSQDEDVPASDTDSSQNDDVDTESEADSPQDDDTEAVPVAGLPQNDDTEEESTTDSQPDPDSNNPDGDAGSEPQLPANDDITQEPVADAPASDEPADAEPATDSPASEETDPEPVADTPSNEDTDTEPVADSPSNEDTDTEPVADSPSNEDTDTEPVAESPANDESNPEVPLDPSASDESDPEPVTETPANDDTDSQSDTETPTDSETVSDTPADPPAIDSDPAEDTAPMADDTVAQIEAINAIVEDELKYQNVLGAAVAVVQNGVTVHAGGYGFTSLQRDDPVSINTVFRWASISKTLTAIAALQLDEATDNFSIDDTVSRHIDYWTTDSSSSKHNVTIKQLLSHRSGVTHYRNTGNCPDNPNPDYDRTVHGDVPFNARQAVEVFSDQSLCFRPGERFRYSTFGFSLAAAALEREAGKTYTDWVREHIAQPLGLQSLTQGTGISRGYRGDCDGLIPASEASKSYVLPGGGWASNIVDLAKFANGILQGSLLDDTARLWNEPTGNNAYALGIYSSVDGQRVSHAGGHGDLRTYMELYLNDDNDTGIVVYLNHPYSDPTRVARRIADELGISNWSVPLGAGCQ